jgi:type VI secretion system Hcp family effector
MSLPIYASFYEQGAAIEGPLSRFGMTGLSEVHEFSHGVYLIDVPGNWKKRFDRKHTVLSLTLALDKSCAALYRLLTTGDYGTGLDKVELFLPGYDAKARREQVYFKYTLDKARITALRLWYPNVKEKACERYGHLLKIDLRYHRITWEFVKGTILYADTWPRYDSHQYSSHEMSDAEIEKLLSKPALTDAMEFGQTQDAAPKRLSISDPAWEHVDAGKKADTPDEAASGDRIMLSVQIDGYPEGASVDFEILDSTISPRKSFARMSGRKQGGAAHVEWSIDISKVKGSPPKIVFEASANSKYTQQVEIPLRMEHIQCDFVIDSHMHIQSGDCAMLPALWNEKGLPPWRSKILLDLYVKTIGAIALGAGGYVQDHLIPEIAQKAIDDNAETFEKSGKIGGSREYQAAPEINTLMIVLTMDMEYAHLSGFNGRTIYHEENGKRYFYIRKSAKAREEDGEYQDITHRKIKDDYKWVLQYRQTRKACANNPWKLLPMYFYDPRRWRDIHGEAPTDFSHGPWYAPFSEVASAANPGIFIGFKMYPSLGYKPLDPRLKHLPDYYARCQKENIPILAHGSPGGLVTHDIRLYAEYDGYDLSLPRDIDGRDMPRATLRKCTDPEEYFYLHYVHPQTWRSVLEQSEIRRTTQPGLPPLKICLAHFGSQEWIYGEQSDWIGEIINLMKTYEGVYTDLSCLDWGNETLTNNLKEFLRRHKDSPLMERIMLGTDWYLSMLIPMSSRGYKEFYEMAKDFLDGIDRKLWFRFSLVNPFEFYGLGDGLKINNLFNGLDTAGADKEKNAAGMNKILDLTAKVDNIKRKLTL